jgi:acyl-[acyl-carrier-protein]-phospholipid O-acyltransferase/long-chain-fatty-acid--[acyl-carrier-protein] ligase
MLLHHRFIDIAKKYGDKLFINDRTTGRKVTYRRALIAAFILTGKLKRYEPGFIGVMIPTSAGAALTILGVLFSGRIPVMVNYSTGAEQNCIYARKKCDFKTIITSKALLEKINCPALPGMVFIEDLMAGITRLDRIKAAIKSTLPAATLKALVAGGDENDDLFVLFTSGSEKEPKAVELTHRNINAILEALGKVVTLTPEDVFLCQLPYFHIFGQTGNLWVPLYFGMTLVTYTNPLDFRTVCEIVREEKCTIMLGTPSFFWGYLSKSEQGDFQSIRLMLVGADKCPEALRDGFREKHGKILLEGYGATETALVISVNTPEFNRPGSVGRPLPCMQVRVEEHQTGEACALGEIGKILVKGDNVMKGYFDDFEQNTLAMRQGWYDTGDMGCMDEDGYLWHVGRLRRFVKIGGEMVSLVKVEDVLERFLPEGVSCCVVEVPDHLKGAKIVVAVTQKLDEKETLGKMSVHLPNIALPRKFVVIEELPKMGSGKIDFRKVTDMVRDMVQGERPTLP